MGIRGRSPSRAHASGHSLQRRGAAEWSLDVDNEASWLWPPAQQGHPCRITRNDHASHRRQCHVNPSQPGDAVVKVDRRIRWHYTTTILRLRIGARLTGYRNCKFHNFARTISGHADGISRYSVPPSAGPLLPLRWRIHRHWAVADLRQNAPIATTA